VRVQVSLAATLIAIACAAPLGAAQQRGAQERPAQSPAAAAEGAPITPAEVQRMFDAYTLVEAQEALSLSEAQYGRFVQKLKALQDARRRHQQARSRILADMRKAMNGQATPDEAVLRDRLKALRDEDDRSSGEIRQAGDAVDEVLDVPQQARFRLFEERMEAKKLELLLRARQNARQGRGGKTP